jgi:hypothetical protein
VSVAVPAPLCATCVHLIEDDEQGLRCAAFPSGIPLDILESRFDHRQVHPAQTNDVVYEPSEDAFDPFEVVK